MSPSLLLRQLPAAPIFIAIAMQWFHIPVVYLVYAIIGGIVIIVQHRDNIARLLAGTERRISLGTPGLMTPAPTGVQECNPCYQ